MRDAFLQDAPLINLTLNIHFGIIKMVQRGSEMGLLRRLIDDGRAHRG